MSLTGTILIADSDRMTLEFFDIVLSKLRFNVVKAKEGAEALEKLKLYSPDIVLIDNNLPNISGLEITKRIRKSNSLKQYKNIPIILFSTHDTPKDKVVCFESGIDDYITKPFNFSEVLARIRTILRHKELSDQFLRRERRLAILESLNTNLVTFTKHIKKPLSELQKDLSKIDYKNENSVKKFVKNFEDNYKEMLAMLNGIEDEIMELEKKDDNLKKEEISLDDLEKKITRHLKTAQNPTEKKL